MLPVMDALREVHRAGILHRDISPDNVYLTTFGGVKVLDFGAARYALGQQSRNLSVILKEGYAPEEQYRTKGNQGPWTDVYATAATLYRAITGQAPTPALDRLNEDDLPHPSALGGAIPADAEACLMKGLAVRAPDRYQSMEDFQQALTSSGKTRKLSRPLVVDPGVEKPVPPPPPARPTFVEQLLVLWRRTPKQYSIGAGALLLLLLVWAMKPAPAPSPNTAAAVTPAVETPRDAPAPPPSPRADSPSGDRPSAPPSRSEPPREPDPPPRQEAAFEIRSFTVEPAQAAPGQQVFLKWSVRSAKSLAIEPGFGALTPVDNQVPVQARQTQTFTLYAEGPNGTSAQRTATLIVSGATTAPRIVSFQATPQRVRPGEQVMLGWNVAGARIVELFPQIGPVEPGGQRVVAPVHTTDYTLMARPDGFPTQSRTVRVEVASDSAPVPANLPADPRRTAAIADAAAMPATAVLHDHGGIAGMAASGFGIRRGQRGASYCQGRLTVRGDHIVFQGEHAFDQPLSEIEETRPNRLPVQGRSGFHIKFRNGDNYNFGAVTGDAGAIVAALEKLRRSGR